MRQSGTYHTQNLLIDSDAHCMTLTRKNRKNQFVGPRPFHGAKSIQNQSAHALYTQNQYNRPMPFTRKVEPSGLFQSWNRWTYHGLPVGGGGIYKIKCNDVPTVFIAHSESNVDFGTKSLTQIVLVLDLLRHFFRRHCPHHPSLRHECYRLVPRGCGHLDTCGYIFADRRKGHRGDQDLNDMHRTRVARHFHH